MFQESFLSQATVFFRSTYCSFLSCSFAVWWAVMILVLICIVQCLPDEMAWKRKAYSVQGTCSSRVPRPGGWLGAESVPKPQTQDTLDPSYSDVWPADSQVAAPGQALIYDSVESLPYTSTWNGCPGTQCLAGASGRNVLVLWIAAVGSRAINHAINPFQWARPKGHLLWGE